LSGVRAFFSFSRNMRLRLRLPPTARGELIAIGRAGDNSEVGHPHDMENVHCNMIRLLKS
jgi:hypothetical protein